MSKRRPLSKRTRFEVFKRDKFACQYCGAKSPDVVLHVDHINPVARGGANDILNLLTSCLACNGGKGAVPISDGSAVERQREQLAALEEKRQQVELMLQWREELAQQNGALLEACSASWSRIVKGYSLSEVGRAKVGVLIKKHGFNSVMDAIDSVHDRFPVAASEKPDAATADKMFKHLQTVLKYGNDPSGPQIAYVIGILRNRCAGRQTVFYADVRRAVDAGIDIERLTDAAKYVDEWYEFDDWCAAAIGARR